jgi:hypothetical protein
MYGQNGVNDHSSRSHHIFQVKVLGFDKLKKAQTSLLNIVDLAGSERFKNLTANTSRPDLSKSIQSDNSTHRAK